MDERKYNSKGYVLNVLRDVDFCQVLKDWRESMAEIDFLISKSAMIFQEGNRSGEIGLESRRLVEIKDLTREGEYNSGRHTSLDKY